LLSKARQITVAGLAASGGANLKDSSQFSAQFHPQGAALRTAGFISR
jgi:hypothetical protein